jgi:hypothetical protein
MSVRKGVASAVIGLALGAVSMVPALEMQDMTSWSLDRSMGAYGALQLGFGGGVNYGSASAGVKKVTLPWLGGEGGLFFDATYAEAVVGVSYGKIDIYQDEKKTPDSISYVNIDLGLTGKYPFELSNSVTLFPMVGISYQWCVNYVENGISYKDNNYTNNDEGPGGQNSRLFFNLGLGMDIALGESMFIRPAFVYGMGLPTERENEATKASGYSTNLAHGVTLRIGLGFKL